MDVVVIFNGLGNQLSQYSFYLAKQKYCKNCTCIFDSRGVNNHNGFELNRLFGIEIPNTIKNRILYWLFQLKKRKIVSSLLSLLKIRIIKEDNKYLFNEDLLVKSPLGINFYWGGWPSEKHFKAIEKEVKGTFSFPNSEEDEVFNKMKTEIEKSIQAYEIRPLSDRAIERACYQHMERYSQEIEAQLDVTRSLSKPLNEANNRYDSIGYREHTAEEEKQAEKEYERCKAEYDREKAKLNKLYDQQKATRKEAFQYMKNCCADIYRQSCLFLDILKKYIPDGKQENKSSEPISLQETTEEQQEYFSMKLLSLIHEVCIGEQFEEISAPDFYANMNLHPCNCKLKIKPREKIRVCYLIFLMSEKLSKQDRDKWKDRILKLLDIDDSYYKSKYKEPVSDFPSDSNQNFAKEMEHIFR